MYRQAAIREEILTEANCTVTLAQFLEPIPSLYQSILVMAWLVYLFTCIYFMLALIVFDANNGFSLSTRPCWSRCPYNNFM